MATVNSAAASIRTVDDDVDISYPPTARHSRADILQKQDEAEYGVPDKEPSLVSRETQAVSPPDQGYAWIFLAAAFFVELLCWGFAYSIGVFHAYWTKTLFPQESAATILSLAATLQTGLLYMATVVIGPIITRYPEHRRILGFGGLAMSVGGIVFAAFVSKPWHLLLSAGIIYPIGACFFYTAAQILLYEWFYTRRGLATGVLYAGTGAGGVIFPFLMDALLNKYSYKAALITLAISYGLFGTIAGLFIKPRIPIPRKLRNASSDANTPTKRRIPTVFFKRNTFYVFTISNFIASLGVLLPSVYLPTFATELGLSDQKGTLAVALLNAASIPGLLIIGYLSDHYSTRAVFFAACFGSALCCFLLWGFATKLSVLLVFAMFYGFFGIGFAAIWSKLITIMAKDDPLLPGILYSFIAFGRGAGEAVSGPIADALITRAPMTGARYGYGVGGYGGVLLWTGACFTLASVVGISYRDR